MNQGSFTAEIAEAAERTRGYPYSPIDANTNLGNT